jgi:tetratricopeptide (TPR) repeat protein
MIQPLDTARNSWRLFWFDLDEPVPKSLPSMPSTAFTEDRQKSPSSQNILTEQEYYLPTCMVVTTASGRPICPPEILEELDQPRVEQLLGRLFEEHGTPDRITIAESGEWDTEAWRSFALDCRIEIAFGAFPAAKPGEIRQVARKIAQRLQGDGFHAPSVVARGLVATASRLRSLDKKVAHLRKAIEQDADCSAARIELADTDYQSGRWSESRRGYQEIIDREERRWRGETPEWWSDLETRPFLRALYGHAMIEWQQGHFSQTAADLRRLLTLNPSDNQGVRFLIPLVHLLEDNDDEAIRSLEQYELNYPDDYCEPALLFGKGLVQWRIGVEEISREAYRTGMLKNLYIAPLLLDLPTPPNDLWNPNDRSDLNYAQDFIQSYATLWDRDPAAVRFVREIFSELTPLLEGIVAHRRQMNELQDQRYDRRFRERWREMTTIDETLTGGPER